MSGESIPGVSGDSALVPTTNSPLTPQLVDELGNQTFYGTTDNANPAGNFPVDDRIVEFFEFGVLNPTFSRGPADPYHDITDINFLPDWTGPIMELNTGSITSQWLVDSGSPSGYSLRYTFAPGTGGDQAYFQQIVPIGGSKAQWGQEYAWTYVAASGGFSGHATVELELVPLDINGNTVATSAQVDKNFTDGATGLAFVFVGQPSAIARFMRIRVRVMRATAATTDTIYLDFSEVRLIRSVPQLNIDDQVPPYATAAQIYQQSGTLWIVPGDHTRLYRYFEVQKVAAPGTPASGYQSVYAKSSDSKLYSKDDAGNEYKLTNVAGTDFAAVGDIGSSGLTMPTAKMLGRATAGTGAIEEITVTGSGNAVLATGPTLSAPVLGTPASGTATNITGLPPAGVSFAATSRVLGRITAGAGTGEELTAANLKTIGAFYTSGDSPTFATVTTTGDIELGNASDTTIHRSGAGAISVEGVGVALNSTSLTHTASTIELGAATDTTLSRASAGVLAVEGVNVLLNGGALGTPSSGTGTNITGIPESGVTSLTTDLAAKAPLASPALTGSATAVNLAVSAHLTLSGQSSPAALSADTNDWSLATSAYFYFVTQSGVGNWRVTGIVAQATGTLIMLYNNDASHTLTLRSNNASSASANRILCPNNADLVIPILGSRELYYNGANWLVLGAVA